MYKLSYPLIIFLILLLLIGCSTIRKEKVYRHGAVVCIERAAAEVGLDILKGGGNACDAACAAALALAATFPEDGNIGGGGFALIYSADSQKVYFIDFREKAPEAVTAEFYLDDSGRVDRDKILNGPSAAGVPGTVAGLYEVHRKFGQLSWQQVVSPARMICDTGLVINDNLVASLAANSDRLLRFQTTARLFFPRGEPLKSGDRLYQADLGAVLRAVEEGGRDGFYLGETARRIAAYCTENGGLISLEDLEEYQPAWRDPVHFRFRRLDIYVAGLPSSGGIVMGEILGLLEPFELEKYTADAPQYLHLFVEAARRAFADREAYLGDPDFTVDLTNGLLDADYLSNRRKSIELNHASASGEILPGMPRGGHRGDETTHLVTADSLGNLVSLTYTLNSSYGSAAAVAGCGFILNNEMDDFAVIPGEPNQYGLAGGKPNIIAPGKRMLSSMSPTIVFESGRPVMALGSPGASKIITAVAQTIINYRVFKMPLAEAVSYPRFHHQWMPDKVYLEQGGFGIDVIQNLIGMGHNVEERSSYGEVMVLGFSRDGSFITGVADPRSSGYVAGY